MSLLMYVRGWDCSPMAVEVAPGRASLAVFLFQVWTVIYNGASSIAVSCFLLPKFYWTIYTALCLRAGMFVGGYFMLHSFMTCDK